MTQDTPLTDPKPSWNVPGITWLGRAYPMLIVFVFFDWLCMTKHRFIFIGEWRHDDQLGGIWASQTPMEWAGPLLWTVPFGLAAYLSTTLAIHLHFRNTIDKDINSGKFIEYWNNAPSDLKLKLIFAAILCVLLSMCILFSPLARA